MTAPACYIPVNFEPVYEPTIPSASCLPPAPPVTCPPPQPPPVPVVAAPAVQPCVIPRAPPTTTSVTTLSRHSNALPIIAGAIAIVAVVVIIGLIIWWFVDRARRNSPSTTPVTPAIPSTPSTASTQENVKRAVNTTPGPNSSFQLTFLSDGTSHPVYGNASTATGTVTTNTAITDIRPVVTTTNTVPITSTVIPTAAPGTTTTTAAATVNNTGGIGAFPVSTTGVVITQDLANGDTGIMQNSGVPARESTVVNVRLNQPAPSNYVPDNDDPNTNRFRPVNDRKHFSRSGFTNVRDRLIPLPVPDESAATCEDGFQISEDAYAAQVHDGVLRSRFASDQSSRTALLVR